MVRIVNTSGVGGAETDFTSVYATIIVNTSGQYEPNPVGTPFSLIANAPLVYSNGVLSGKFATPFESGFLSAVDFTTFNGKLDTSTTNTSNAIATWDTQAVLQNTLVLIENNRNILPSASGVTGSYGIGNSSLPWSGIYTKILYADNIAGNVSKNRLVQAWCHFSGVGGATIGDSYGVSSVLRNNIGDYTVNWTVPFLSDRYCVTALAGDGSITNFTTSVTVQSGNSCRITTNNLASLTDVGNVNVIAYGFV